MSLDVMMTLEGLIAITLVIAAIGTSLTQVFRNADYPYIITLSGSRLTLLSYGVIMTATAIGLGIAGLVIVSSVASPIVALALFFGIEAVALDICFHRTRFIRVTAPAVEYARVRITLPFNS